MNPLYHDRTIALAGMFQALRYVQRLANDGTSDIAILKTAQRSVLSLDASNTASVFGELAAIEHGLLLIERLFCQQNHSAADIELTRYSMMVIQLERKLTKNTSMLETIADRLKRLSEQIEVYSFDSNQISSTMSGIYEDTLSTLLPRIMVFGKEEHLQHPDNKNRIRTALLAAIRAAVLFHQKGGRRWQYIFARKPYCTCAKNLLKSIHSP